MKYIKQFGIILAVSFIGELLAYFIPLAIPASIYGIVLMFAGLKTGVIPYESVRDTGRFLIEIMPMMFIPAAVGLMTAWKLIQQSWLAYIVITVITTVVVMAVSGLVTQAMLCAGRSGKRKDGGTEEQI